MYTFADFARDQTMIGLRVADDHIKQFCGGEHVVACAFIDVDGLYGDARENVYNHLYTLSKMVYLTHTTMLEAIMNSNADNKIVPCGPYGRGLGVFFKDYTSAITIIVGDIDADSEMLDKIFIKSDFVVWISRRPLALSGARFYKFDKYETIVSASCVTMDGEANMSMFRTMDLSDD
jgi:hypothetical protein